MEDKPIKSEVTISVDEYMELEKQRAALFARVAVDEDWKRREDAKKKDDVEYENRNWQHWLDVYAGQAMHALMSNTTEVYWNQGQRNINCMSGRDVAEQSYEYALAMMEERERIMKLREEESQ